MQFNYQALYTPIKFIIKILLKVFFFIGFYWIFICMSPVWLLELIGSPIAEESGSFLGIKLNEYGVFLAPNWLYNITWYLTLFMMAMTILQRIYFQLRGTPLNSRHLIFEPIAIITNTLNLFKWTFRIKTKSKKGLEADLPTGTVELNSGLVFGKQKGKTVIKEDSEIAHTICIGGSGSGKSSGFAIPSLIAWKKSAFVIDIKGELYHKTSSAREKENMKQFNPSIPSAFGYNPFYILDHTDNVTDEAESISNALIPLPIDTKDPFWIKQARNYLTGCIIYCHRLGKSFSECMYYIQKNPCADIFESIMSSEYLEAQLYVNEFLTYDEQMRGGIIAEVTNNTLIFATDKSLQKALNGKGNTITPDDLENGYDVFICIEEHKLERWKSLMNLIVTQFLKYFEKRSEVDTEPILFLLDEYARLGRIELMVSALATLRSKNVQIVLLTQSLADLDRIYGKETRRVMMDNCTWKSVLLASDQETQEYFSKLVGTYDKTKLSSNYNSDVMGVGKGMGTGKTTEEKAIIKPEEFGCLSDEVICITPKGYKRLTKINCYLDKEFSTWLPDDVKEETKKRMKQSA